MHHRDVVRLLPDGKLLLPKKPAYHEREPMSPKRYQDGQIHETGSSFHIRYYVNALDAQGKTYRRRVSEFLCQKDAKHFSATCPAVKSKATAVMAKVNENQDAMHYETKVSEFFTQVFLPWCEKLNGNGVPNIKASTLDGWKKIYRLYLSQDLQNANLQDYTTNQACRLLTRLAEQGLGVRVIEHTRSLAHRIFKHALQLGVIGSNPWNDAQPLSKPKAAGVTHAYTLDEAQAILAALRDNLEAAVIFACAFFGGLRPSEISGLKWEDLDNGFLFIKRSCWKGHISSTKTAMASAPIPLVSVLRDLLERWRAENLDPASGFMFAKADGNPKSAEVIAYKVIRPACLKAGITWHGLYAGRRGVSSLLTEATGNALAASYLLRHSKVNTTETFYTKLRESVASEGIQALESRLTRLNGLKLPAPAPAVEPIVEADKDKDL